MTAPLILQLDLTLPEAHATLAALTAARRAHGKGTMEYEWCDCIAKRLLPLIVQLEKEIAWSGVPKVMAGEHEVGRGL